MITVEDIQIKVYQLLKEKLKAVKLTGSVGYTRHDFTKEDVIILSKGSEGSSDICVGSIVVNIHVPDIKRKKKDGSIMYDINFPRLMEIRTATIEALNSYYNAEEGYNWLISHLDPATKEQDQDEHFFPVYLEIYIRHNK